MLHELLKDVQALKNEEVSITASCLDNISVLEQHIDMEAHEVGPVAWELKKYIGALNFDER